MDDRSTLGPLGTALSGAALTALLGLLAWGALTLAAPGDVIPLRLDAAALGGGALIGLGCLATGRLLGQGVVLCATAPGSRSRAQDVFGALAGAGALGGWALLRRRLPWLLAVPLIALAAAGEELAFRGVLLPLLGHALGPGAGFAVTAIAFVALQRLLMPSWHLALVPMAGALVLAIVLGFVALQGMNVLPLVAAHAVYRVLSTYLFATP